MTKRQNQTSIDNIFYYQEKTQQILDLTLKYNFEEIGFFSIFKATYFLHKGKIPCDKLFQFCRVFDRQNEFKNWVENFAEIKNGFYKKKDFDLEIKSIEDKSKSKRDNANSRKDRQKEIDTNVPTDVDTNVDTNGVAKTIKQQNNKTLILEQEKIKQQNIENNFNEFWNFYTPVAGKDGRITPKGSKADAKKAYQKAIQQGFTKETILIALESYLKDCQKNARYTKHASTWLNESMRDNFEVEDVFAIQPLQTQTNNGKSSVMDSYFNILNDIENEGGFND